MPGLVRGIARTAVIAGTATATANAVNRRQASKNVAAYEDAYEQEAPPAQPQYAAPAPSPATASMDDQLAQLERLSQLKAQGILTDEEFAAEKAKILGT
jgi:predicted cobalt transporter CbtA